MDLLQEIDLDKIVVQSPRRNSEIDLNSLINLRQSIDEIGVVEPILVQQDENGNYPLISGERRVQACRDLGFKTIPARMFSDALSEEEILLIKVTENLQRSDLNPISESECYQEFFRITIGCNNLDDIINTLVLHTHQSNRLGNEIVEKISTLERMTGKTSRTIQNMISILKLPTIAQKAIANGKISLSQGYLLYKYRYHRRFDEILHEIILKCEKMTNAKLVSLFDGNSNSNFKKEEVNPYHQQLKKIRKQMEKKNISFEGNERDLWLREIDALRTFAVP